VAPTLYEFIYEIDSFKKIVQDYKKVIPYLQKNDKVISTVLKSHHNPKYDESDPYDKTIGDFLRFSQSFFVNYVMHDSFLDYFKEIWINITLKDKESFTDSMEDFMFFEMFRHCVISDHLNGSKNPDAMNIIRSYPDIFNLDYINGWNEGFDWGRGISDLYLFSWDQIPGNDSGRLIEFIGKNYGIDWVKTAKIDKIDDGKAIIVFTEKNSLSLKFNPEKIKLNLTIDDGRRDEFVVKMENGHLNIYKSDLNEENGLTIDDLNESVE
jgi:hypothetical protein